MNLLGIYNFRTLSSRTDNRKSNFLVLGEGPADGINDSVGEAEKKN